jgi:hypothetical protein
MDSIGKNETITQDAIFFFATVNDRQIMLDILFHFQGRKISMASFGSFLDGIILKEKYFAGTIQKGYNCKGMSYGKAHSLFLEYEKEVFIHFNSGKTWLYLERLGMPHNQAFTIWHKFLNLTKTD